jgi:hypothetical protein
MTTCRVCRMADSSSTPEPRVTKVRQYRRRIPHDVTCAVAMLATPSALLPHDCLVDWR